jgi:hypothetical protein
MHSEIDIRQRLNHYSGQMESSNGNVGIRQDTNSHRFFFLCLSALDRFFLLCVAILCRFRFLPLGKYATPFSTPRTT